MRLSSIESDHDGIARVRDLWVQAIARRDSDALRDLLTDDYEVWALLILRRGTDGRWRFARGMTNGLPAPE